MITANYRPATGPPAMITANYPAGCRKVDMIMKTDRVYPIFGVDFSPGDEFSAYITAKSPSGEIST
jgi:hypothetical protein